jgi:hypothetical protein
MNRTKIKNYAPQARRDFIRAVTDRAAFYGLTADRIEPVTVQGDVALIAGRAFPSKASPNPFFGQYPLSFQGRFGIQAFLP